MDSIEFDRKKSAWLIISLTTLILLVYFAEFERFVNAVKNVSYIYLGAAFVTANIALFIHAFIWQKTFSSTGFELNYSEYLKLNLSGLFIHNLTPMADAGAQPFIAGIIQRYTGEKYEKALTSLIAADLMLVIPIYTLALLAGTFVIHPYLGLLAVPGLLIVYLLYVVASRFKQVKVFLNSKVGFNLEERIENSKKVFSEATNSYSQVSILLLAGLLSPLLEILAVYILVLGTGVSISLFTVALITPLTRLTGLVPTPGSSGVYEVVLTGLLVEVGGLPLPEAVVVTSLYRLITYYFGLLIGYLALNSLSLELIE